MDNYEGFLIMQTCAGMVRYQTEFDLLIDRLGEIRVKNQRVAELYEDMRTKNKFAEGMISLMMMSKTKENAEEMEKFYTYFNEDTKDYREESEYFYNQVSDWSYVSENELCHDVIKKYLVLRAYSNLIYDIYMELLEKNKGEAKKCS